MNEDRDAAMRNLAMRFSQTAHGVPLSDSVGAAALFIVCLADQVPPAEEAAFRARCAEKLRAVADLLSPKEQPMKIKIKKLHPDALVPTYGTPGSACFDLYSIAHKMGESDREITYHTGLGFEVPEGHVMLVFSRSGHGFRHGARLANCVGVIDSDFRDEVLVKHRVDGPRAMRFMAGNRIAQALVLPVEQVQFDVVDELSKTERGTGGFGSTGA